MPTRTPPLPPVPLVALGALASGWPALQDYLSAHRAVDVAHVLLEIDVPPGGVPLNELIADLEGLPVRRLDGNPLAPEADVLYILPAGGRFCWHGGMIHAAEIGAAQGGQPLDSFFRDVAEAMGSTSLIVQMGPLKDDGYQGLQRIKEHGGISILAVCASDWEGDQEPAAGFDIVVPLPALAGKIEAVIRGENSRMREDPLPTAADLVSLREILTVVRVRTGHDFASYKRPTVLRRIGRRMQVHELGDMAAYARLLREQPDEVQRLLSDLLITVTNFFRDPESFAQIEQHIIPRLFEGKGPKDCVRVWSCGCSSGEEPYSLAILLTEYRERLPDPPKIQIFASDINQQAVRTAREGKYRPMIAAEMTPERLKRFFQPTNDGGYQVVKQIRDTILFAPHNLLHDPPFSHLDLVVCRNLLIYLNRETQKRVMELLSFALDPGRFLFLGSSEGTEGADSQFSTVDKKHRIFANSQPVKKALLQSSLQGARWDMGGVEIQGGNAGGQILEYHHHRLLSRYAPPSVLISADYEILHVSGDVGEFMQMPSGIPTKDLIKSAHPSLQLDLRAVLMTASREKREAEIRGVRFSDHTERLVNLLASPVDINQSGHFLVVFDAQDACRERPDTSVLKAISADSAVEAVVRRLEEELQETRERLHLTIEQGEVTTEELKASNEELQAINEELRSATEELETSKEELQSVNEELATVNMELKEKVDEISGSHSDLQNLMHSSDIGTVFLTRDLNIKRYTRRVEQLLNIIESDIGRPFEHITHKFDYNGLAGDAATVLETLQTIERVLKIVPTHAAYLARVTPYRTLDDRIEGVVISFVDITELRRTVGLADT